MSEPAGVNIHDDEPPDGRRHIDSERRDAESRQRAVDPRFNVALEASAGTGKTRVLVDRYVNLLRAGVDPANILAMTFTRKAAAEMRERIVATLRTAAARGELTPSQWRTIRDRLADINISTIDAFCLSLLREFPLEAGLDPGFALADDTDVPRLIDESLDRALRICRSLASDDEHVALVFAQLGDRRARAGLASLLHRRLVAPAALARHSAVGPRSLTLGGAAARAAAALRGAIDAMPGGSRRFFATGPAVPGFVLFRRQLEAMDAANAASVQAAFARAREHFLTHDGQPRSRLTYTKQQFRSAAEWNAHRELVTAHAGHVREAWLAYRRDLNALVSRGVRRMFHIAEAEYRRTLDAHAVLDFPDVLLKTLDLLRQMEEFSQSRYRLESRYHHLLIDEFQDTSRAQWELIALLVRAWGEGAGLAHSGPLPPSIFIVGDRKQSIYGFRDAQVSILREAAAYLNGLRPDGHVRRSIAKSFRAVPEILAFVNDVCVAIEKAPGRADAFEYEEQDRFPVQPSAETAAETSRATSHPVSYLSADSVEACAEQVGEEIARLLAESAPVRDRETGLPRPVGPADIAILFRTRDSHRDFEAALERRGVLAYVYKGLGFFDADEVKDLVALLWYLAEPASDLRAAAFLRSRFIRLSDDGLRCLGPRLSEALDAEPDIAEDLDPADRRALSMARRAVARWRPLVDRVPPAELVDLVLHESAYALETRGPRAAQARENLKKLRALVRRAQNRGYATLARIAAHLDRLSVGDEANAAIDATGAVSLMTIHAAKGLEFPIVFVVNLSRGTSGRRPPIRVAPEAASDAASVAVGDFESEWDEDNTSREREETKRLLYVALTRARDRLYLSTPLEDGRLADAPGSLAEVLPAFVVGRLESARVPGVVTPAEGMPAATVAPSDDRAIDFAALRDTALPRASAAAVLPVAAAGGMGSRSSRLVGITVHRLLQRIPWDAVVEDAALSGYIRAIVDADELTGEHHEGELIAQAETAFRAFRDNPEIRELYAAGRVLPEVPFTMLDDGPGDGGPDAEQTAASGAHGPRIVRGTVDCLVLTEPPDGGAPRITVLEFKTGARRVEHEFQAALYTRAVQVAYPSADVSVRLLYVERNQSRGGVV